MSLSRRIILAIGFIAVALMALAPPARYIYNDEVFRLEHRWLSDLERRVHVYQAYSAKYGGIDTQQLGAQILAVAGFTAAAWVLAKPPVK